MRRTLTLALVALLTVAGCKRSLRRDDLTPRPASAVREAPAHAEAPPAAEVVAPPAGGFAPVVERVAPAVVNVASTKLVRPPSPERSPFFNDPLLRDFFGGLRGPRPPRELRQMALGSGVIISRDGYVLTNDHVVQGASEVRVTLPDKRELKAKIVGADPKTDIALLRISGDDYPVVPWGDSTKVRVGHWALAFGDPLGLGPTVTAGIISATGRGNVGIVDYEDFIQTDAAINPGNSGGPLVNTEGELIGINTAIATTGGGRGNQGIGFAVPSNLAREVIRQIEEHGHVVRGWLGVAVQEVTPAMGQALDLKTPAGALVSDVQDGSPAAKAGLQRGDVIVELDGKPVSDSRSLRIHVAESAPGTVVKLGVTRDGKRADVTATLGEMPAEAKQPGGPRAGAPGALGMQVSPLTPDLARRLDLPPGAAGVIVTGLAPGSRAAEAGLRPGDVIQEVDRARVQSPNDLARALEKDKKRAHLLLVWREGETRYVALPPEEAGGGW